MERFLEDRSTAGEQLEESWKTGEQSWRLGRSLGVKYEICFRLSSIYRDLEFVGDLESETGIGICDRDLELVGEIREINITVQTASWVTPQHSINRRYQMTLS